MTRKQARKHDRICLAIVLIIGAVLMVHTAVAAVRGASEKATGGTAKAGNQRKN